MQDLASIKARNALTFNCKFLPSDKILVESVIGQPICTASDPAVAATIVAALDALAARGKPMPGIEQ